MMSPRRLAVELDGRLDGPHADEHTSGAANLAAECVRFLNYATGSHAPGGGVTWPSTVYEITGGLSSAVYRMDQLAGQMARWLEAELDAGRLAMDDRSDPAEAVARAVLQFECVAQLARQLSAQLESAQQALGSVNGRGPARDGGAL